MEVMRSAFLTRRWLGFGQKVDVERTGHGVST